MSKAWTSTRRGYWEIARVATSAIDVAKQADQRVVIVGARPHRQPCTEIASVVLGQEPTAKHRRCHELLCELHIEHGLRERGGLGLPEPLLEIKDRVHQGAGVERDPIDRGDRGHVEIEHALEVRTGERDRRTLHGWLAQRDREHPRSFDEHGVAIPRAGRERG